MHMVFGFMRWVVGSEMMGMGMGRSINPVPAA